MSEQDIMGVVARGLLQGLVGTARGCPAPETPPPRQLFFSLFGLLPRPCEPATNRVAYRTDRVQL